LLWKPNMNLTCTKYPILSEADPQQTVIIYLSFPQTKLDDERALDAVFDLEEILRRIIFRKHLGEFDGNEFCEDTVTYFIYGNDADAIIQAILPYIQDLPVLPDSHIFVRYGDDDRAEEQYLYFKQRESV
jgi:hypothetical protein